MTRGRMLDADYVVTYCQSVADTHKLKAAHENKEAFEKVKDRRLRDEYLAKAQILDIVAEHFRKTADSTLLLNPETEALARQIDPEAFSSYDALIVRLEHEGRDHSYAVQIAEATYGDRLQEAREKAVAVIPEDDSTSDDSLDEYSRGLDAAVMWHESRALEAETLEANDPNPAHKQKYAQRAKRHRLYAKHIQQDLIQAREAELEREREAHARQERESQPTLPFLGGVAIGVAAIAATRSKGVAAEQVPEDIPLEVQMQFLRKTEVMDDEGW